MDYKFVGDLENRLAEEGYRVGGPQADYIEAIDYDKNMFIGIDARQLLYDVIDCSKECHMDFEKFKEWVIASLPEIIAMKASDAIVRYSLEEYAEEWDEDDDITFEEYVEEFF